MMRLYTTTTLFITGLLLTISSIAQPGALDLSFNPGSGGNGYILSTALQPDGKILVAGTFTVFNGVSMGCIARLNASGSLDTTFHTGIGFDSTVYTLSIQPNGKIVAGGKFSSYNGSPAPRIIRLNTDGSVDTTFNPGTGISGFAAIKAIALQADDKIIASGYFTSFNGIARTNIVRLNSDGSVDNTFDPGSSSNGAIDVLAIQADGKIVIGGSFTIYQSLPAMRVCRINANGNKDLSFNTFPGASSWVLSLLVQPDQQILMGGNFVEYEFQPKPYILRLNPNSSIDASFDMGQGPAGQVYDIQLMQNHKILFGGHYIDYDNFPSYYVTIVDSFGRIDTAFALNAQPNNDVFAIEVQPNGKIIIAGKFTSCNGVSRNRIARLYNCLTPQPDSIYGNSYALCSGTPQTYSVNPVPGATNYQWTLPNGWTGSSDSASITATSGGTGGVITVKAFTDSCGWSYTTTRTIATIQPNAVPLCLVTVDTQSTHNIVLWEKPQTALIDSFFVYRETTSNVYTKIAAVAYNALSEYHDTAANPNTTSYRYKLSVLDTCGAESDLSLYHSTIHLQNLGNGNFQWTFYNIESTANPVLSFNVYRDAFGNGNWFPIGNVPGTNSTFTDVTANSFPNALYVVDANWGISCDPSRAVNTTRSNIKHKGIIDVPLAINEDWSKTVQVFPNPAKDRLRVMLPDGVTVEAIKLTNSYGQLVKEIRYSGNGEIQLHGITAGVYGLWIETNAGRVVRKVVIE